MKLIAVTGSIGCGKTTIAGIIRKQGYAVFDVDAWVRRMYFNKDFIKKISEIFPKVYINGAIDKRKLRSIVFNDNAKLKILESLTHPFLINYFKEVIHKNSRKNYCFFVDIALLYELKMEKYFDLVVVADVDYEIQKQRVMARDKVNSDDFEAINAKQMKNSMKVELADIVINTGKPLNLLKTDVLEMIKYVEGL